MNNKLTLEIIALANFVDISRQGMASISGIFDEIYVDKFPAALARAFLFFTISGGDPVSKHNINIQINDSKGKKVAEKNVEFITGRNGKANYSIELVNLPLPSKGKYKIELHDKYRKLGSTNFLVMPPEKDAKEQTGNSLEIN